jgi:hypothetical protein
MPSPNHAYALFSALKPSVTQVANSLITQHINTGDRVKDNALVVIANTLLAFLCTWLYCRVCRLWYNLPRFAWASGTKDKEKNKVEEADALDTNAIMEEKDLTAAAVQKYAYTAGADSVHRANLSKSHTPFSDGQVTLNSSGTVASAGVALFTCAVVQYAHPETTEAEYIFLSKGVLYCQHLKPLQDLLAKLTLDRANSAVQAAKICSIYNLEVSEGGSSITPVKISTVPAYVTMDTVFIADREKLLKAVKKMQKNTLHPKGLAISNKLGILLYGPPGTGKTKCISGLANHLQRAIFNMNLADLYGVTQSAFLSVITQYKNTAIFVFDELDHLLDEAYESADKPAFDAVGFATATEEARKAMLGELQKKRKAANVIDRSFLLRFLDGIGDDDERVFVACTNNPERIDSDFLRPGRFDLRLKLSHCAAPALRDIVAVKFGTDVLSDKEVDAVVAKNITPAEVIQGMMEAETLNELRTVLDAAPTKEPYLKTLKH